MDEREVCPSARDLMLRLAESRLGYQKSTRDSADTKAGVLLSALAVLLPLVLSGVRPRFLPTLLAGALLLIAFGLGVWAYFVTGFRCDPNPVALYLKYQDASPDEVQRVVIRHVGDSYNRNQTVLHRKELLIKCSMGALIAALLAVAGRAWWGVFARKRALKRPGERAMEEAAAGETPCVPTEEHRGTPADVALDPDLVSYLKSRDRHSEHLRFPPPSRLKR